MFSQEREIELYSFLENWALQYKLYHMVNIHCLGLIGRVPAFQVLIWWGEEVKSLSWGWVCVLSSVISGGDLDILLTTETGRPALQVIIFLFQVQQWMLY